MKKKLLTAALLLVLSFGVVGGGMTAFADVSPEQCDLCFQQTVNGILEDSEVEGSTIVTTRRPLYDLNLENMGYVYSFDAGYGEGYAIIICDNGNYVTQEFVKSAPSPYAKVEEDELCVYPYFMTYLKASDGVICNIETSVPLSQASLDSLREFAFFYQDGVDTGYETKTINVQYTAKSYDCNRLNFSVPEFYNNGNWSGGCAAVAGGNLIGYYDRFYEDLIPNHAAGISNGTLFQYNLGDEYVNQAISILYSDMGGSASGISEDGFKSGMKKYCSRKGLSCDFTSLKSGGNLNYDSVKSCINGGNPLVLFLNTYTVCTISEYNGTAHLDYEIHYGNHVMPGFGYSRMTFTLKDGSTSEYKFVWVTTGWLLPTIAYFNIDYLTNIVSAYKINIY